MLYEVTSPQAFDGLRAAGRAVRRPELNLAVADQNVRTQNRGGGLAAITERQGIVHVIGPELTLTRLGSAQWGTSIDVASTAIYLASSASDFVTDAPINFDGGYSVRG